MIIASHSIYPRLERAFALRRASPLSQIMTISKSKQGRTGPALKRLRATSDNDVGRPISSAAAERDGNVPDMESCGFGSDELPAVRGNQYQCSNVFHLSSVVLDGRGYCLIVIVPRFVLDYVSTLMSSD